MPHIANPIKVEILRRNKTVSGVAEEIGITVFELSRVMHGHRIRGDVRRKLAEVLNTSEGRLFRQHRNYQRQRKVAA